MKSRTIEEADLAGAMIGCAPARTGARANDQPTSTISTSAGPWTPVTSTPTTSTPMTSKPSMSAVFEGPVMMVVDAASRVSGRNSNK